MANLKLLTLVGFTLLLLIIYDRFCSCSRRSNKISKHERIMLKMIEQDEFEEFCEYVKTHRPN